MKNPHEESTYALLVRCESEEKSRGLLEALLYTVLILSTVLSICQFAQHPVKIPAAGLLAPDRVAVAIPVACTKLQS
jgi:hypothetical protein